MAEQEGVVKYRLRHRQCPLPADLDIGELNAWRQLLFRLQLIGCRPDRYGGLGYGNISRRLVPGGAAFLISATQTGHLPVLDAGHYALVGNAVPEANLIESAGPLPPSSEALTHAGVYRQLPHIQAVAHVHCPEIWRQSAVLQLPCTPADVAYGTPQMARAVAALLVSARLDEPVVFGMLGHEDGIVACGADLPAACTAVIALLARALALQDGLAEQALPV